MSLTSNTEYKVIKRVIIIALMTIGIFFLALPKPMPYVYGIIFGTVINILNFRLMSLTFSKAVNMTKEKIMPYIVANYMARYTIYGVVLTIAAIADYISFYTTILGIFMVKIVIVFDAFYDIILKYGKNTKKSEKNKD